MHIMREKEQKQIVVDSVLGYSFRWTVSVGVLVVPGLHAQDNTDNTQDYADVFGQG